MSFKVGDKVVFNTKYKNDIRRNGICRVVGVQDVLHAPYVLKLESDTKIKGSATFGAGLNEIRHLTKLELALK